MAPVVKLLARTPGIESLVCTTAQHRQMLDQVLAFFDLPVHHDLDIMTPGQGLHEITERTLVVHDVLTDGFINHQLALE